MKNKGFTIVELLIVIVVIGILASITIVAYNGIQRRANNTSTIAAARSAVTAVRAYIAANEAYPATGSFCLTNGSGCRWGNNVLAASSGSAPANIATISTLPDSTPVIDSQNYGVVYNYRSDRTYNGVSQPVVLIYFLSGFEQNCQIPNLTNSGGATMGPAAVGWTASGSATTTCVIHVPGP